MHPTLRHRSDNVVVWSGECLCVQAFYSAPTVADLDAIQTICSELPKKRVLIDLEKLGSIAIDGDARRKADELAAATKDWVAVTSMAVMGSGMTGCIVRGVISAVTSVMGNHPLKVCDTLQEAIEFVGENSDQMAQPCTAAELQTGIDEALGLLALP